MRRALLAAVVPAALLLAGPARADAPDGGDSLAAAQAEFANELAASATAECGTACRALESLRRAADGICALDPGPPCADARAKLENAAERVRSSCPECPAATIESPRPPPPPAPQPSKSAASPPEADMAEETTVAASPAPRRGGCASCAVSEQRKDPTPALAVAALAALVGRKRRRRL